tara:strand:+ start:58 stop:1098 length:1041 start_codon:yes stop_codon:yes gene_type:complete
MKNFIIISGFAMTGKTVLTDIFKEFKDFKVPKHTFEFNMLRIQGGLLDLQNALVDDYSPIRADYAIKSFKKNVLKMGTVAKITDPKSLFISNGMNYNEFFNNKFIDISNEYINNLIDFQHKSVWPYQSINYSYFQQFYYRFIRFFLPNKIFLHKIYITKNNSFVKKTREYFLKLYNTIGDKNTKTYVLHNTVEPYNPSKSLNLFNDAKLIVVYRDPRDIYASSKIKEEVYVPKFEVKNHWNLKSLITFSSDIDLFINRQKKIYSNISNFNSNKEVLYIRFEDIILNYDSSLNKIYKFLNLDSSIHHLKKKFFNPKLSVKNIGIWKKYPDQSHITKIKNNFPELCYD